MFVKCKWDVLGFAKFGRSYEAISEIKGGHLFCHSSAVRGMWGVGFMVRDVLNSRVTEFIAVLKHSPLYEF